MEALAYESHWLKRMRVQRRALEEWQSWVADGQASSPRQGGLTVMQL